MPESKKEKSGTNSERLLRVLEILRETDEEHPITAQKIVEKLENVYFITAEKKAVCRDIASLNSCGYSIELSDDNKLGWYYVHEFEDWQLKVMTDAVLAARFLDNSSASDLAKKIMGLGSNAGRKMLSLMNVPSEARLGERSVKYGIDTVLNAIKGHKKLIFNYHHLNEEGVKVPKHSSPAVPVSPYRLIWQDDKYYLIASYKEKELSYYRLDRMEDIRILDEKALPLSELLGSDEEHKLKEFIKLNIYSKKGPSVRLELRLLKGGADAVYDTFGSNAQIIRGRDGIVSAYITVSESEGLYSWLMQHALDVTVVSPEGVREEMRKRLEEALSRHSRLT